MMRASPLIAARAFLLGLAVYPIAGCATHAQREFQAMRTTSTSANDAFKECVRAVYDSPEYEPIRPHLPLTANDATLNQLMDTRFVTEAESQALVAVYPKLQSCKGNYLTSISTLFPTLVPIYTASFDAQQKNLITLLQRKESWGDYVQKNKEIAAENQKQVVAENQNIVGRLNEENRAELAQRQAAAAAFAQYMQNQQIINNMNRPVVTNCNQFGSSTTCVSN